MFEIIKRPLTAEEEAEGPFVGVMADVRACA